MSKLVPLSAVTVGSKVRLHGNRKLKHVNKGDILTVVKAGSVRVSKGRCIALPATIPVFKMA